MSKNILLCGVGGQGTVLASKLIARAAMDRGLRVMSAETIGMAQRGGSVFSHIRIGEDVQSPMIALGEADILIAFEPAEAVRMLPYLKQGGSVVTAVQPIQPTTATLGGKEYDVAAMLDYLRSHVSDLVTVDTEKALAAIGSKKAMNILLLGKAVRTGSMGIDADDIMRAIEHIVPARFHEMNRKALYDRTEEMES